MAASGTQSARNRKTAAPPRAAKMGPPSRVEARISTSHGAAARSAKESAFALIQSASTIPSAARPRPDQRSDAFHANRNASSAKPTGMTACPTQTGTPAAISMPPSRSICTSSRLASPSNVATIALTPPVRTAAALRNRPSGRKFPVARASRRLSRAARAAPRKAIHRVRCCSKGSAPGIPVPV